MFPCLVGEKQSTRETTWLFQQHRQLLFVKTASICMFGMWHELSLNWIREGFIFMLQNKSVQTSTENAWDIREESHQGPYAHMGVICVHMKTPGFRCVSWFLASEWPRAQVPQRWGLFMPLWLASQACLSNHRGQVKNINRQTSSGCHHGSFAPYKQPIINSFALILAKSQGQICRHPQRQG